MQEIGEMSRKEFSVAYAGMDRADDHSIDVETLAPALLAFGKLIREANRQTNGKSSTSKVLVVSDFEHKCFNINFEVVLSFYEQVKSLIGTDDAKSAKEILEWLGLFAGGAGTTLGFIQFLRWRRGRKIEDVTELTDTDETGTVAVKVDGDGNAVHIHNHTWQLAQNPRALAAARDALSPVGTDGFDTLEVRDGDKIVSEIPSDQAEAIISSCSIGIEEAKDIVPDVDETTAWLTVYSPVYDEKGEVWRFRLGKDVIYADISDTNIAHEALERGGALAEDTYQVRLEITTPKTPEGKPKKPTYKVLSVLRFIPAEPQEQTGFDLDDQSEKSPEDRQD